MNVRASCTFIGTVLAMRLGCIMSSLSAPVFRLLMTGTHEDLRTVETALAWLRPRCPRCGRADCTPLTWYETVIWFQCAQCYKLWREVLEESAVALPEPSTDQSSTQPMTHVACGHDSMLTPASKVRRINGYTRSFARRRVG